MLQVRAGRKIDGEGDDKEAERQQKQNDPGYFNPRLGAVGESLAKDIDANMRALDIGVAEAKQEQDGMQVPFQLLQQGGAQPLSAGRC